MVLYVGCFLHIQDSEKKKKNPAHDFLRMTAQKHTRRVIT